LLAEEAGIMAGWWSVRIDTGDHLVAAGLLVLAGADHQPHRPLGRGRA
jgi:hypothetical protein